MSNQPSGPRAAQPGFSDHTFTSSSGFALRVRVWPADPPVSSPAPFVCVTHGGGFVGGHHFTPPPLVFPGFRARGYHVASHSYRLAPQARLDEQVADCLEAVAWMRANLPAILGPDKVDVDRYVLYGDSAGGLLVTLMGLHLAAPPPRAIVDVYGVMDIPDLVERERQHTAEEARPWTGEFGEAELEAFLSDRDPANLLDASTSWREMAEVDEKELSRRWATEFRYTRRARLQSELHVWRSQHPLRATLFLKTLHLDRFGGDEARVQEYLTSVTPLRAVRRRLAEGRTQYPPTAFLHGTGDRAVPVQHSYDMARALRDMGVPVIERYEEGEDHVWDHKYTSADVKGWNEFIQPILDFVDHHVGR
ncbi:uncharacterized protein THITE_2118333 [Thermothielavioides terrestris NRRL 8126]|uniref:Alpha/beta hydrolase fold-3 domain-containing protein n=1 Tax=Thermothielavioides terrestris (strain ATCC 38088 / NRRL 8126) TaxID=578455 RepID=G2R9P2_THETT|nr:uncharacterized protein THITE_2118333 [Thermothielavioides terrestris NRRL 8126]AEO68730.1 hypothetical protein THITE_2118333 [Thermothielavioides terrestris NRRL 8126]